MYWSKYYHYQIRDTICVYNSSPDSSISVEGHDLAFSKKMNQEIEFHTDSKDFENSKIHNRFAKLRFVDKTTSD